MCLQLSFEQLKDSLEVYRRHISNWSNVLVTINSAVNFIVYCVVSKQFRTDLVKMVRTSNLSLAEVYSRNQEPWKMSL